MLLRKWKVACLVITLVAISLVAYIRSATSRFDSPQDQTKTEDGLLAIQNQTIPQAEDTPTSLYPKFDFQYEQNAFHAISKKASAILTGVKPMHFCGEAFYDFYSLKDENKPAPQYPHQVFDCNEIGDLSTPILKTSHTEQETPDPEGGFLTHAEKSTYTLGKYAISVDGQVSNDTPDKNFCNFSIKDGSKEFFKIHSDVDSCGNLTSIVYGKQLLLFVQDPFSGGNAYAWNEAIFFFDGTNLHELGTFVIEDGDGFDPRDFWVDKQGNFYFWFYDGRYEGSFSGSHNSATYAFVPRVFKVSSNGVMQEGITISQDIAAIYTHQLTAVRNYFTANTFQPDDHRSNDPLLTYWVGMARMSLKGDDLKKELDLIKQIQKKYSFEISEESGIDSVYSNLKE